MAKKIKKISIVDQVEEEIKKALIDGVWKEGDRLPTEAEFAEMFGVNRLSVRLALGKLSALGLIETRVGEGSFVKKMSLTPVFDELSSFYSYDSEEAVLDVMQFRYLIESDSMRRAEKCATDEEKQELKARMEIHYENWNAFAQNVNNEELKKKAVESDYNFHYQIVKMSHNRIYRDVYKMIRNLLMQHMMDRMEVTARLLKEQGLIVPLQTETHFRICQAIIEGDESMIEKFCSRMVGFDSIVELAALENRDLDLDKASSQ